MRLLRILTAALPLGTLACACFGQGAPSATADGKLRAAIESTSLNADGMRAWHWMLTGTLYDLDCKNPQPGTIEAWYAAGDMRTILTIGTEHLVTVRKRGELMRDPAQAAAKFVPLEIAFAQALQPIPAGLPASAINLKLASRSVGKTKLDCVEATLTNPSVDSFSTGPPLSYCFLKDSDQYVAAYQAGSVAVVRSKLGRNLKLKERKKCRKE